VPECQKTKKGGLDQYGGERFGTHFCHNQKKCGTEKVRCHFGLIHPFQFFTFEQSDTHEKCGIERVNVVIYFHYKHITLRCFNNSSVLLTFYVFICSIFRHEFVFEAV